MAVGFRRTAGGAGAVFALAAVLFAPPAGAVRPEELTAGPPGKIVDLPEGRGEGELLSLDAGFARRLLALAPEEGATVPDWPVSPGVRRTVRLVRHEVWDEGARVLLVGPSGTTELRRSRLVFFWGGDLEGAGVRALVWIDPATGTLKSFVHSPDGPQELAKAPDGRHLLAAPARPHDASLKCGQEDFPETASLPSSVASRAAAGRTALTLGSLYKAVLAIDTDNEYLASFSNDTAATTAYIATLVANINVMYERDLNLRLVVGTTILRTTTDPWTVTGSGASGPQLSEFTNYWNTNYPKSGTPRSFGALFSGKSTSGLSGIAWLAGSVCGGGSDYSFDQISSHGNWLWGDTLIVGHEIGHNMGSPHTHCYSNPAPDRCYAGESCYTGATSCPAAQTINGVTNVTGTIMSYCHLLGGCSSTLVFHPSTISRYVGPALDSGATAACIVPVVPPPPPPPAVSAPTTFHPVTPCRVLDTRNAAGPLGGPSLGGGSTRAFTLSGTCGVPAGAVAVSANVTTVSPAAGGSVLVYPNGISVAPTSSTISTRAGKTRANNAVLYLASDGSVLALNGTTGSLDLVLDVNGYFQ